MKSLKDLKSCQKRGKSRTKCVCVCVCESACVCSVACVPWVAAAACACNALLPPAARVCAAVLLQCIYTYMHACMHNHVVDALLALTRIQLMRAAVLNRGEECPKQRDTHVPSIMYGRRRCTPQHVSRQRALTPPPHHHRPQCRSRCRNR